MIPKVYIETSIPSFYYETRTEPEMAARRTWTRQWWDERREGYEIFTSEAVIDELSVGAYPDKDRVLAPVAPLPLLPIEPEIAEIVEAYIQHTAR